MRRFLDRLYDGAGALAALSVFLIFLLMIWAGVGRQLNWRVSGVNDVVAWLCAAASFLAMAHAFRHGDFVRVTLLLEKLPAAARRAADVVCLLIALVSAVWLKEAFHWVQGVGVALALAGVVHVIVQGRWMSLAGVAWAPGDAWIVCATVSWTLYSVLLRRWHSPLTPMARLAAISVGGVVVLLPFTAWEVAQTAAAGVPVLTLQGLGLALAAAVVPGFAAYLAYSVMQRELGAARVGVVIYLGPLYAAGLAWLVLGESLHGFHALGGALVLLGIYLVNRPAAR